MWSEARVAVEEVIGRCFPTWTRRSDVGGREVRSDRSCRRVGMVVEEGICKGIAKYSVSGIHLYSCASESWRTFSRQKLHKDLVGVAGFGQGM